MYHHQNNGGGGDIFSHRGAFLQERHLFGINNNNNNNNNLHGDSGLVLSTDAKPRLKWTPELHQRFIEAVNQLGGAEKATPKTVMRLMGIPGLTLYHLKSHLQKYRLSKNMQAQANLGPPKNGIICVGSPDKSPSMISSPSMSNNTNNTNIGPQTERTIHISEALQLQIEVQRQLNEQLEVQRHLQLRIEAQGKYLQAVLEKAQETLGKNNNSELDTKNKANLVPELSQVETECYINKLSPNNLDCSIESSLTEELGKVYNPNLNLNSKFDCKLDLNLREESENLDLSSRRFDLNGFSWN